MLFNGTPSLIKKKAFYLVKEILFIYTGNFN